VLHSLILTETILKSGNFHKGTIDKYNISGRQENVEYLYERANEFNQYYKKNYPKGNSIHKLLIYCYKNPGICLVKFLLSPIYFFCLASREVMSYILLLLLAIYLFLTIGGLKKMINNNNIKIILIILFGYFLLHWLTHSYSRYSLVILPFLFVYSGKYLNIVSLQLMNKIKKLNSGQIVQS